MARPSMNSTRRNALEKLAILSAQSPSGGPDSGTEDLARLCRLRRPTVKTASNRTKDAEGNGAMDTSRVPMGLRELEVLLALCKAAPLVTSARDAEQLLQQLAPYLPEAHNQIMSPSPFLRDFQPWEVLSYELTSAVLALGLNCPAVRATSLETIESTISSFSTSAATLDQRTVSDDTSYAVQLTVSLLGFLNAASRYAEIWTVEQRLELIQQLRDILSEKFMVGLEGALSAMRNVRSRTRASKEWKRWLRHYAARGRPLGAMLLQQAYMQFVESCATLLVSPTSELPGNNHLDMVMTRSHLVDGSLSVTDDAMLESLTDIVTEEMNLLEADADYLQVSSAWQQRLALEVKASSLRCFLICSLINEDIADADILLSWLEVVSNDPVQFADEDLAQTVLKCMAILARTSAAIASSLSRSLPRLIVQGRMTLRTATVTAECLASILKLLSQDVIISTLYSLGNVLSASTSTDKATGPSPFLDGNGSTHQSNGPYSTQNALGSAISLVTSDEEETAIVYGTVVQAIVGIASACRDEKITALVISMLVQKIGRISQAVDAKIITETAVLGLHGGPNELRPLLRLYAKIGHDSIVQHNGLLQHAVMDARLRLAADIERTSPLYEVYLVHMLSTVVSSGAGGDTTAAHGQQSLDSVLASKTIAQLLRPMAVLVSSDVDNEPSFEEADVVSNLSRDAWFNIVVHGFTLSSSAGRQHADELQILAQNSLPLIDEDRAYMPESGIDLNTVLRRGMSQQHAAEQKSQLIAMIPNCEADVRSLSYAEVVFVNAALLVSTLRARSGDCTGILPYFLENRIKSTPLGNCMSAVALCSVDVYLGKALNGTHQDFSASHVAQQLAGFFEGCCHRIAKVQHVATSCADRIINQVPSALCQRASLFALLELLSLIWTSCLEAETEEYEWKSTYSSAKANVTVQLSDDIEFRQVTLNSFYKRCRIWVSKAMDVAPLDVKGLLQAYLSDYADDGAYGHISLGRSFALEMGSLIPSSDQRLGAIDRQRDLSINTASDFIAQYTTRQEYRHVDDLALRVQEDSQARTNGELRIPKAQRPSVLRDHITLLSELAIRIRERKTVPFEEIREALRDGAGLACEDACESGALIHHLVAIPFALLSKQSIKLGISLWMGIIKENPKTEARILVEIATGWEASLRRRQGIFNTAFQHLDPFYIKEEFAPSKKEAIVKRQHIAQNLVSPHLRLVHFLSSHFNATRLTSPSVERVYNRTMRITLLAMRRCTSQPLAREVQFHILLLALKILRYSTATHKAAQWRLKDGILSAGLAWFSMPPRWSYGGNRLQMKAEVRLIGDVAAALSGLAAIGSKATQSMQSLHAKQELLLQLLASEASRLTVWITPLSRETGRHLMPFTHQGSAVSETTLAGLLRTAWAEDPRIAIQLVTRFPKLTNDVRWLLLNFPQIAIDEPEALQILLGSALPSDVKAQLKYLLYWAPVNPMAAVTYFLPAYGNHPFIIQYAMRALESHSVDITFFYVPQIVQTLRYDVLGYVERYIIETAKFSQLFAHQIIWNIKANAYKDEDSEVPDPMKPTLDSVMDALIGSFSAEDKDFYEREFDFFSRVTGISGKLKPFIKRPKPEKKQKIEEELRQIQVDVGVYLPSNPDGVIVGIDRKSGKPLQSHAKAPFMATFRIRKEKGDMEAVDNQIEKVAENGTPPKDNTYEVWQSAIFKVGDDCRQDVLALQMIAAFRGIFNNVGLDVYVFPYRVTATAPGCGVIDVLPNSISRDILGREAVNGLYEYFVTKYGNEDSIRFQEARSNFVKSMAAYSVISYLLQFKDRHNGNIMVDDAGHILHIDFGFCFDIAPGGVKFERAPFKLTSEMLAVMGGSTDSQPYHAFEELCVKAFLASRQYAEKLSHIILVMIDSGLPCFKPTTIQHFKERFVLEKTEREAADFMRMLVHRSERSYSTMGYDQFQLMTNGIPY